MDGPALDHVFVFVEPGAPERAGLERAGLLTTRHSNSEGGKWRG
jgi:hypothetical protein